MPLRLPRLRRDLAIVDDSGRPTKAFQQWFQSFAEQIEAEVGAIEAAQIAQEAAETANAAAAVATAAADTAQASADGANSVASLTNSGVTGTNILTATDAGASATINIAAHTRVYGDGTTLAVGGGSLTGLAYSTLYFVYYDDPTRADTTPTYASTTSEATAAQVGDRHLVGQVTTPAAAAPDNDGDYVRAPGIGNIIP